MFERFTERSRKSVVLAQEEARHFNHNYIGTEHLLLGLLREEEGVAARTLASLNVTLDEVREQLESIVGYGEEGTGGKAPFTRRSKRVLEMALREALLLGHNYIGTEHLLLGLMREGEGVANRILGNLDVGVERVRREILQMLDRGEYEGISTEELWETTLRLREVVDGLNQAAGRRFLETATYATLGSLLSAPIIGVTVYVAIRLALKKTLRDKGSRSIFRL
ncbi:MAG: Clp protease N-terminal domain-containing protein [Rubrobacteraceae bacterium]